MFWLTKSDRRRSLSSSETLYKTFDRINSNLFFFINIIYSLIKIIVLLFPNILF